MWTYSLTVDEEAIVAKVGWERQLPYLARPEANMNYSEGDVWESLQHMICAGSELAFARMLGLKEFTPHVNKWKTELDVPGFGEVRYAFPPTFPQHSDGVRGMRMTTADNDDLKYVLMVGGLGRKVKRTAPEWVSPPYIAVGWMFGHEVKQPQWSFNEKTFYAPVEALHPMETIS